MKMSNSQNQHKTSYCTEKAQVEIETILAIVFSLIILIAVIAHTIQQQKDVTSLAVLSKEKNQCILLSTIISLTNTNAASENVVVSTELDTTITQNNVFVGNTYCSFSGNAQDTVLSKGKVRVFESEGVVMLENA